MQPTAAPDFKSIDIEFFNDRSIAIELHASLANFTTFRLGGPCVCLVKCQEPEELEATVRYLHESKINFILIGGGSNLVVSDRGVAAVVIRYASDTPSIRQKGYELVVTAATKLDDLARFAAERSLEGLNCTTGIPGTVGGAIVGNAGAFGKQVGDVLKNITLLSKTGERSEAGPETLDFRYRYSNLKERDDIVLSACFSLQPGDQKALERERQEILHTRRSKHPDLKTHPCAGSFFRNIEPTSKAEKRQAAGWFLEQAGVKDLSVGGARIFEKHANIIVNDSHCTSQDVFELSKLMARAAKEKFDLDLVREVRFVGEFEGKPKDDQTIIW